MATKAKTKGKEKAKKGKEEEKTKVDEAEKPKEALVEEDQEHKPDFRPIEDLKNHGIKDGIIKKLKEAGYNTVESVAMNSKRKLTTITGISEETAKKLLGVAHELVPIMKFNNALDFYAVRNQITKISTGSKAIDKLLDGGIECGYITEIFGEFGTGKTQLCHQLCVTCQLPFTQGGGQGRALVIDTEGGFRPERCAEIANKYQMSVDDVLTNISYVRAFNTEQQLSLLTDAAKMMAENTYALIIVDSATALYRTDYTGRGELSERQNHLAQFMRKLSNLVQEFGIVAFVTNQVVANPGNPFNEKTPIGGNIMAHASTTRLQLRKAGKEKMICKVYDSPHLAQNEAPFIITKDGIDDVDPNAKKPKKGEEKE